MLFEKRIMGTKLDIDVFIPVLNSQVSFIQPTISLEMPVPSQGHYGFHSFPVVD
jgi:hypothetical protein